MIEIKAGWWETKYVVFQDHGPLHTGAKTRLYKVLARLSKVTLGYVRWQSGWRKYGFYPLEKTIFDENCLLDIAAFTKERSVEYKAPGLKKKERANRIKRQIRYREEKSLTNEKNNDNMGSVSEMDSENPKISVVEGSHNLTPLEVELGTISF